MEIKTEHVDPQIPGEILEFVDLIKDTELEMSNQILREAYNEWIRDHGTV